MTKKIKTLTDNVCLGIDPSLSSTGFCVINIWTNEVIDYGVIQTSKKQESSIERIDHIKNELHAVIDKYRPKTIIMEGLSFGSGGQSTRDLAGLFHVLVNHFMNSVPHCKICSISPKTLKKRFANNGKASKEEMNESLMDYNEDLFYRVAKVAKSAGKFDIVDAFALASQYENVDKKEVIYGV